MAAPYAWGDPRNHEYQQNGGMPQSMNQQQQLNDQFVNLNVNAQSFVPGGPNGGPAVNQFMPPMNHQMMSQMAMQQQQAGYQQQFVPPHIQQQQQQYFQQNAFQQQQYQQSMTNSHNIAQAQSFIPSPAAIRPNPVQPQVLQNPTRSPQDPTTGASSLNTTPVAAKSPSTARSGSETVSGTSALPNVVEKAPSIAPPVSAPVAQPMEVEQPAVAAKVDTELSAHSSRRDSPVDDEEWDDEDSGSGSDRAVQRQKVKPVVRELEGLAKEHVNIVFIGHVDAGKSTISGQILFLTGMVDKRTLEKYEKEAKEKNRETWYLSWALDTNPEEREKGKTVECGRAFFETEERHYTILDAPGHKSFVPNMISGASQADVAILVISARKGEFETGFEKGGQTREHALLVKTAGVEKLLVLINKMDDPTVKWDEKRYMECKEKISPYLKKLGWKTSEINFIPISGQNGENIKERSDPDPCPWYSGPTLLGYLDGLKKFERDATGATRIPLIDRFKDMGTIVIGKVESGTCRKGQNLILMPNRVNIEIVQILSDDIEVEHSMPGENVRLKIKGVEEDDVSPGFVLCSPDSLCHTGRVFDAQIHLLEYKSIICAGYTCVMHIHSCVEEVVVKKLICTIDRKGEKVAGPRFIKQDQAAIVRFEVAEGHICMEKFADFQQMGRFTLRDEGKTIAIGKVLKVVSE